MQLIRFSILEKLGLMILNVALWKYSNRRTHLKKIDRKAGFFVSLTLLTNSKAQTAKNAGRILSACRC